MVGGYGSCSGENLDEAKKLFNEHKDAIASQVGVNGDLSFEGAELQVVAGINYRITASVGGKKIVAVIYRKLDRTSELTSAKLVE